ncbi:MAG: Hpt domain-containing protein [Firmicutes bacterium]|nr:Hpt domain-containing protein [Bacillota bacterium]
MGTLRDRRIRVRVRVSHPQRDPTDPELETPRPEAAARDRDFYLELLRDFSGGFEERKEELDRFVLRGELGEYNIRIHSLKGSLRTIGAEKPAEEAFALEQASGQNDGSFVHANHAAFMTECTELAKQIAKTIRNA